MQLAEDRMMAELARPTAAKDAKAESKGRHVLRKSF